MGLLNSKLIYFYLKNVCTTLQGGFYDFRRDKVSTIPISNNFSNVEVNLTILSQNMIEFTTEFNEKIDRFLRSIEREFNLQELSKKLQDWYLLTYGDFIKEFAKKKVALSLSQKAEWEDYFTQEQRKAIELKNKIDTTDKEIDSMVYELYGLTKEEIEIVENS